MFLRYKIADTILDFNVNFNVNQSEFIELFAIDETYEEDSKDRVIFNIKDIEYTQEYKKYENVYLSNYINIYKNDESIYWYYKLLDLEDDYSCLVEDKNNISLYIDKEKKYRYKYISDIYKHINLQGALLRNNKLILHSSFIIYNNESILFTAMSGVGKSTQAKLWETYQGAEIINGDRASIGVKDDILYAYGIPFCGSSNICKNKQAPIKAIVLLEQGKSNRVYKLSKLEAFKALLGQVAINRWNKNDMSRAIDLIENLINSVPVVKLSCLPNEDATNVLKKFLYKL